MQVPVQASAAFKPLMEDAKPLVPHKRTMAPRPRLARHPMQRNISSKSWASDLSDRSASHL